MHLFVEGVHIPVLPIEVGQWLEPAPGKVFLDGTVGAGGHAALLAPKVAPGGLYVGLDRDPEILAIARDRLTALGLAEPWLRLRQGDFAELGKALADLGLGSSEADGILLDLGVSSWQLDRPERGFGFASEGPLDMRMDPVGQAETAADLVNRLDEADLADLIYRYGEERFSRRIARAIVEERRRAPIHTTTRLADVVKRAVPGRSGRTRRPIHPATRTFQALRIAVNGELEALERALAEAPGLLRAPGGRIAVISFHSLEDRIVKRAFLAAAAAGRFRVLTKKPVRPGAEEIAQNRRARSAKLRVAERVK